MAPKLKDEKTQTQGKFPENSRIFFRETQETGKFGANIGQILRKTSKNCLKIAILAKKLENFRKLKDFCKTQARNLSKTQETGNSANPILPEKRTKKTPGL